MKTIQEKKLINEIFRKPSILICISFLLVLIVTSILAYLIIPDKSKNANTQYLEIALKEPGFTSQFLTLSTKSNSTKFGQRLFYGDQSIDEKIPFKSYRLDGDDVVITTHFNQEKFISGGITSFEKNVSNKSFVLGTDKFGRDILSRLILGIRVSLFVGLMSVLISLLIGITVGSLGGFFGGTIDKFVMYVINIAWSIPTLLLVFAIVIAFGRGIWIIFLAVGLTLWVDVARLVRGQVLQVKESEFIEATRSLSFSPYRVIKAHILPNIIGPILVIAASNFAISILIEAGLSYLGFGIQPPAPSVGNMLNENYGYAISGKPFLALIPALTIMLLVLAFNLIGSGLRDILDVKSVDT